MAVRPAELVYPLPEDGARPLRRLVDRTALRLDFMPCLCPVCGAARWARRLGENLRETGRCRHCGSFNRQRQLAYVVCRSPLAKRRVRSLAELARGGGIAIFNTETRGAVHRALSGMAGYVASEYLGPERRPGEVVEGVRHEDLQRLSFAAESFDLVLSSDVLEHVPEPYRAHEEVFRVLRPGGRHVFTVPFDAREMVDDVRARLGGSGEVELLNDPIHHLDPLDKRGALVYTIFGLEMLVRLREIGFAPRFYHLYRPLAGIVGPNAIVFEAVRPQV